jgi:mono/diheme cytochrome c family protein
MNKNPVHHSNGVLFLIFTAGVLLVIARSGLAQSNKQPDNLDSVAAAGDATYGEKVYHRVGCVECHGQNAEGSDGPPLLKIKITFPEFVHWVRNASNGMDPQPPATVTDSELADIYAFIESSPKSTDSEPTSQSKAKPETSADFSQLTKEQVIADNVNPKTDAENGKKLFSRHGCDKCHGPEGQGGGASAKISPLPDSLQRLIQYVRQPTGKMPASAADVISDKELADIYSYLKTQSRP